MNTEDRDPNRTLSRRTMIQLAVAGTGVLLAGGAAAGAAVPTKAVPKLVAYQSMPKGAAECDKCTQYQAPAACKVVAGAISPKGWCTLYAAKA